MAGRSRPPDKKNPAAPLLDATGFEGLPGGKASKIIRRRTIRKADRDFQRGAREYLAGKPFDYDGTTPAYERGRIYACATGTRLFHLATYRGLFAERVLR